MIWKQEIKKLIQHPIMWCLLIFFMIWNGFLIWENIGDIFLEVRMTHQEILYGKIDSNFYQESLHRYDTLDMTDIKEIKQEMYQYYPTGSYQKFIDKNYEKLNARIDEIVTNKEAEDFGYIGVVYRLHNKLYVKILRWVFLEMGIFIVFAVLFLMDYERIQKTTSLVYTSYMGRKIQCIKWTIGILTGLGFGGLLLSLTLGVWFCFIPYKGFWNTSISSALLTEPRGILLYPFITFHKMTIAEYLLATIFIGIFLVIIVGIAVGVMQLFLNNSYLSLICMIVFLMLGLYISGYSTKTWLDIVFSWNPADLWYRMGNWFMEGSLSSNFKNAEIISVIIQLGFWGVIGKMAYQKFERKSL